MTTEENVHVEVSDIVGDLQEVENKCVAENGNGHTEFGSFCIADSDGVGKEEVVLDNVDRKNDADGSYVFVNGSEVVAADGDSGESDLNGSDSDKKSNSEENVPCFTADSNGTFDAPEGLQGELSSGKSFENSDDPAEHRKFDGQKFDIEQVVDGPIEMQPVPESLLMVSEVTECELKRQQQLNTAEDSSVGSVVSANFVEESCETKINSAMSPEPSHSIDGENVRQESVSASDKESQELKDVAVTVEEKELSEYTENVRLESDSVSATNVTENEEFHNLVGATIQNSPENENGTCTYNENVEQGTESVSVPDLRGIQEFNSVARADSPNNLADKDLSEYGDEIAVEGKPVSGTDKLKEDLEQNLTEDSCFVGDTKIGAAVANGFLSNESSGLISDYIQDEVSKTADSNHIAGEHNIPIEIIESDLGSPDSNQETSQCNGLIESVKTSPVTVSGENALVERNQCQSSEDKIENLESSTACIVDGARSGTACEELGTKESEIGDSYLAYDTQLNTEPDNGLLLDRPSFHSDTETDIESHANSLADNGGKLDTCSVEDVKLVPETENLPALSSTDTPRDSNILPNMDVDSLDSKDVSSVEKEEDLFINFGSFQEVKVDKDSRPTQEASVDVLDGQNLGAEIVKKPFYFLIRIPRYDEEKNIREQIKHAQFQVDDKTKRRDAIRAEIQIKKATRQECFQDVEAAISAERAARDLLKSKRQEMDSVQSIINRLNNAISVEGIAVRIKNMEHMIEHETLPLKEEKLLLHQIKQLKQHREELSSNMAKQEQLQQSSDKKGSIEEHFESLKLLRKEAESLRQNVLKLEAVTKAAKVKYDDEYRKLSDLSSQFRAADDIRQEAFAKLQALREQLHEKIKHFWDYRNAANKANELAAEGKSEELQCFCVSQVESIMQLWNTNDEFRREYVRSNTRSTLRRLRTLDGRSLGPDEEPPVIPSFFNESASKMNSSPAQSTLEQEDKAASAVVNSEVKPVSKELVQSSLPPKTKKPAKPPLLEKSSVMVSSHEEEDVKEEPRRMTEEEELILRRAEEKRKEEEAARLKETRRLEEIAKAQEAMLRKQRNAERAQQRAALRALKEAEQKQKEREKKARKKERRKASAAEIVDNAEESMPALEDVTGIDEECEKPVEVTKRQQKPSQMVKSTKAKSIPLPLRNRGKRRMQPYMWVSIVTVVVVFLFILGNNSFFLRSGLQD